MNDRYIDLLAYNDGSKIHVKDIEILDFVHCYQTGKHVKVSTIKKYDPETVYRVTYDDGRCGYHQGSGNIYLNEEIVPFAYVLKFIAKHREQHLQDIDPSRKYGLGDVIDDMEKGSPILITNQYSDLSIAPSPALNYHGFHTNSRPCPYSAGALFVNGDFSIPYANVPGDRIGAMGPVMIQEGIELVPGDSVHQWRFKRSGDMDDENYILWDEIIQWGSIKPNTNDLRIPRPYITRSKNQRWEFIRGAFDNCYQPHGERSLNMCISGMYQGRMIALQELLFTLGIMSKVSQKKSNNGASDRYPYTLELNCSRKIFSKFFNRMENIESAELNARNIGEDPPERCYIRLIEQLTTPAAMINVILPRPHKVYIGDNFLPIVSA